MVNNFRNGYTCKKCVDEHKIAKWRREPLTPVYFRIDKKFVFANLVRCSEHGISEAIALRDL